MERIASLAELETWSIMDVEDAVTFLDAWRAAEQRVRERNQ